MALAGKHPDLPRDMAASAASAAHRGPAAKQRADEEYNLDGVDTHQAEGETDNVVTIKGE